MYRKNLSFLQSSSLLSLSLKFWDLAIPRHHAVRLQCPYTSPSSTMTPSSATAATLIPKPIFTLSQPAMHEIQPSPPEKPLGSHSKPSKPKDSTIHSQKPIIPSLHPIKPTVPSLTWTSQTTPLVSQMHQPQVLCHSKDMSVTLPPEAITGLTVQCESLYNLWLLFYYFLVLNWTPASLKYWSSLIRLFYDDSFVFVQCNDIYGVYHTNFQRPDTLYRSLHIPLLNLEVNPRCLWNCCWQDLMTSLFFLQLPLLAMRDIQRLCC